MKGFMYLTDRRSTFARALFIVGGLLVHTGSAPAQTITSGVIEGVVVDQNAVPMAEVLIQVTPMDGGPARSTLSNRAGVFRFALMPAGRYQARLERIGYRPVILEDVRVSANGRVPLSVRLVETPPPVESTEQLRWTGAGTGSRAGATQLLTPFTLDEMPWERREMNELARLASAGSRDFEVEGLPSWLNGVRVDGLPFRTARNPSLATNTREVVLPMNALSVAELVTGDADVEWGTAAGGTLSANTRRGGNPFGARVFGAWSGGGLRSSELFDAADVSGGSIWGGALLSGALIRDTAQVAVGFEFRKLQTPTASVWGLTDNDAAALINAGSLRGQDLAGYAAPYAVESTSFSGFGRFDWQLAENNQLSVRAALGSTRPGSTAFDLTASGMPHAAATARDFLLSASLSSILSNNWAHELRAGFGNSAREYADDDQVLLPGTTVVNGATIGSAPNLLGDFRRSDLTVDQSLQIPFNAHQVKAGLGVGLALHDNSFTNGPGDFTFGGASQLGQSQGVFVQNVYAAPEVSFSTLHVNAYVQDTWEAAPGVQLLVGVRADLQTLPQTDIRPDPAWLAASGLDNTLLDDRALSVSPRFGLTWDVGSRGNVIVRINAGRFANEVDPTVISELLAGDGDVTVRRSFGALGAWPAPPGSGVTPVTGTRLTLLGPSFRGPQSDRFAFGMSNRLGGLGTLHLSAAYRKTSFLPRRSDLNLVNAPVGEDQHGRPLFGTLSQSGQLLTAAATNRRFRGYDVVTAISADGSAEYRGVTVGLERDAGRGVRLFGSYTWSQTTDDWPARGVRAEASLSPFPDPLTGAWLEGTSDFDLPHRAVLGLEFVPQVAMRPRLTTIYRFQSGYPFTPGFRVGVDANGDGSDSNDPAFVDTNITGIAELLGQFDCLNSQTGQFAARNACRGEKTHELDLRLGLNVLASARTTAQLFVEGVNLMDAQFDQPDHALVLIDATRSIQVNQATGTVTVPLIANPNFGKPLLQRGSGRMLRVGLQVNF